MRNAIATLAGLAYALVALAALGVPMPRLYGLGCDGAPLGLPMVAVEETDFPGRCRVIGRIAPW